MKITFIHCATEHGTVLYSVQCTLTVARVERYRLNNSRMKWDNCDLFAVKMAHVLL